MTVPRFWREQPQRYRLIGAECGQCGSIYFPPRSVCPKCRRESVGKMAQRQLSGRGKVLTHTTVYQPADQFELQVPYVIAIIELEEECRVTAQVVDINPADVKADLEVEATFRRIREDGKSGMIYYGYKFRPARAKSREKPVAEPKSTPKTVKAATRPRARK